MTDALPFDEAFDARVAAAANTNADARAAGRESGERIDAHLHVWKSGRSPYNWLAGAPQVLKRDHVYEAVEPQLAEAGITGAVLVQADDTASETAYLAEVASQHDAVVGVVGWVPLEDTEAAARALDADVRSPWLKGIRQLIHDDPRAGLLRAPVVQQTVARIRDAGLAFDVPNAWPRLLDDTLALATAVPDTSLVVDHLAKPPTDRDEWDAWARLMTQLAERESVTVKLSGLQDVNRDYSVAGLRRVFDFALETYGPGRILYGGDWPISELYDNASTAYASSIEPIATLIGELSASEQHDVWAGTARRVYGLSAR